MTTTEEQPPIEGEPQEWVYEEPTTTPEFIASATNALSAVENFDTAIMTNADRRRVERIRRRSLRIIDYNIGILYDELFDEKNEEE